MRHFHRPLIAWVVGCCALIGVRLTTSPALAAPLSFEVTLAESARSEPATGRLVVWLAHASADESLAASPAQGFVEEDPQPMFGVYVDALAPGASAVVDDSATAFPVKLSQLPAGRYRAQAVLDVHHDSSDWSQEPGNIASATQFIEVKPDMTGPVKLALNKRVGDRPPPPAGGKVEFFEVRSKLLSDFRGREVILRAGVVPPLNRQAERRYPAVYEVPGFGGDHYMAIWKGMRRTQRPPGSAADAVARNTFWICLDPESGNGHTLFADSDNNGPVGQALISELIPAIEAKYNLMARPEARVVTGHSSGGWSSLWLATEYPQVFGACWSSAPDPIDFRRFELVDIYSSENLYVDKAGKEIPAARFGGKVTMTTRQENGMEQVLGPDNDSGCQWDSWQGVWGHKGASGWPKVMFDPVTGRIDHDEAESYRRYDIGDRLRKDPKRFIPIFRNNVRLVCGGADTYYLEEAVKLVQADLDALDPVKPGAVSTPGYIKIVPGTDHGSVTGSPAMRAWPEEMMAHLRKTGSVPASQPTR